MEDINGGERSGVWHKSCAPGYRARYTYIPVMSVPPRLGSRPSKCPRLCPIRNVVPVTLSPHPVLPVFNLPCLPRGAISAEGNPCGRIAGGVDCHPGACRVTRQNERAEPVLWRTHLGVGWVPLLLGEGGGVSQETWPAAQVEQRVPCPLIRGRGRVKEYNDTWRPWKLRTDGIDAERAIHARLGGGKGKDRDRGYRVRQTSSSSTQKLHHSKVKDQNQNTGTRDGFRFCPDYTILTVSLRT